MPEQETLEVDVVIVGGGLAGLSCAIRLVDRVAELNRLHPQNPIPKPNVLLLEKGASIGAHALSGAVLDPKALDELIPDWWERNAPIRQSVTGEEIAFLTATKKVSLPLPLVPPYLRNHGNYIVSLVKVSKWLGEQARRHGIEILEGVAGARLLTHGSVVQGVACQDTGRDKSGKPGPNFQAGAKIHAKVTVFAEGVRGSLTKELTALGKLDANRHPQTYATGVKELWEVPEGSFPVGQVMHTLGFPLQVGFLGLKGTPVFGGSFLYGVDETHVAIGLVAGLDYQDPCFDLHHEFQRLKQHPKIRSILEKGKAIAYGAKAIPEGGYYAMPRFYGDGFVIVGDSASFLNAARLKGAHLAMKSGMLAADAVAEALAHRDFSMKRLGLYEDLFQNSWAHQELYAARNWRAAYAQGLGKGFVHDVAQRFTGGRGFMDPLPVRADHEVLELLEQQHPGGKRPARLTPDGKLTFDKVSDVYLSGTVHAEHQPSHLVVPDSNICVNRCTVEYGNPCQYFCPAAVYEWVPPKPSDEIGAQYGTKNKGKLQINAGNCVHCKTCDIKDPYENILWVVPEGGGGPRYQGL